MNRLPLTLCLLAALLYPTLAGADERSNILTGVKQIACPGLPGPVCVYGDSAVVLVADDAANPAPVAAAATLGKGRLVALGHNGYFDAENLKVADTGRFVANLAVWAAGGTSRPNHVIGLRGCKSPQPVLTAAGLKCQLLDGGDLGTRLAGVDVVLLPAGEIKATDLQALEAFVRRGGGIVSGIPGWGFLQTHAGSTMNDLAANHLFAKAGIVWADGTVEKPKDQHFTVKADLSPLLNASTALQAVVDDATKRRALSKADSDLAATTLARAAQAIPADDTLLLPKLEQLAGEYRSKALTSDKTDLLASNPIAKVVLTFDVTREKSLPPEQVKAHPLAKTFPGLPPTGAPRVQREVAVDLSIPDWHSTGLYAGPGEIITVALPANAPKDLKLRIGSHSDKLWNLPSWQRVPEIDRVFTLRPGQNRFASAFGGLIYVVVSKKDAGSITVSIGNAIESPLFVLGKTDPARWRQQIRLAPGPWAEVASEKVIFTVPSEYVRKLDDPTPLMNWWDKALDGAADLYQIPHARPRPERYVADVQISAGYMHSGYPIMTHLDAAPRMVDLPTLRTKGDWGLFHELGHNHQKSDWTFAGTVEVTNNLLPLYLLETLCNHAPVHGSFTPAARAKAEAKYIGGGADFAVWQKEPFTALIMYEQLREAFGWETYQKVFAEYRDLPADQRPKTEQEKRDQWMVRFSRAANRNLAPFFQHWGIPISEEAKRSVASLPAWEIKTAQR